MKTIILTILGSAFALSVNAQRGYGISSASYAYHHGGARVLSSAEVVEEEIFNYHTHEIEAATYNDPVMISHMWGNNKINQNTEEVILQIGLATHRAKHLENVPPANLSLVVDVSGSMSGQKLQKSKEAMRELIKQLRPSDNVSLVLFGSSVTVPFKSQNIGDKKDLLNAIDAIGINGSTNVHLGMKTGYEQVASTYLNRGSNRVIVFTDARANTGMIEPNQILNDTKVYIKDIELTFIGIGMGFNQDFAREIKTRLRGHMHFVQDAREITKIFRDEVEQFLAKPYGKNAELTIDIPKDYALEKFYGYQPTITGNRVTLKLNDMQGGLTQIFMLKLTPNNGTKKLDAIDYSLSYVDQNGQNVMVEKKADDLKVIKDANKLDNLENASIKKNFGIVYMANELKDAVNQHEKKKDAEGYYATINKVLKGINADYPTLDDDMKYVYDLLSKQIPDSHKAKNLSMGN